MCLHLSCMAWSKVYEMVSLLCLSGVNIFYLGERKSLPSALATCSELRIMGPVCGCAWQGLFMFIRAVQVLRSSHEGIMVVGLAGPSGAGKTVFSSKVRAFLPGTAHIQMDMYNDGTKVVDENFDDPRLTDYDTLLENISGLRRGEAVQTPVYDFRQVCRSPSYCVWSSSKTAARCVAAPCRGKTSLLSALQDMLHTI